MIEVRRAGPWPRAPFLVDLDAIERSAIDAAAVADLERDAGLSIGFVRGTCAGAALAAAVAVDLVVAAPAARFGRPGEWTEIVVRRGVGIVGAKVIAYLAMTGELVAAPTALTWGLVNVVDADPEVGARRLGESIVARSTRAVDVIRRQAHAGAAADHLAFRARRAAATDAASAAASVP